MQRGSLRGWVFAASLLTSVLVAASSFAREPQVRSQRPLAPSQRQLKHEAHVRREMRAAMHRERLRHHARMQELAHRDRATRRTKDLDEKQRVHDLQMAERLLFAQRMRDLRMKAPESR